MRRAVRIALRVLAVLAALLALTVIVVVIALHTAWGRERVRQKIEAELDAKVRGDVAIGSLEGSVLGEVVLHDVVVRDAAGAPVITIDRLAMDLRLLPLIDDELDFRRLHADGVVVRARREADGALDLSRLVVDTGEPMRWAVTIQDLAITHAAIDVDDRGEPVHVDDVMARGTLVVRRELVRLTAQVDGWWRERAMAIGAGGRLDVDAGVVTVRDAIGVLGEMSAASPWLQIDGDRLAGHVVAHAPRAALSVTLDDTVAAFAGSFDGAPITGAVNADLATRRGHATVYASGLVVGDYVDGQLPRGVDGPLALAVDGDFDVAAGRASGRVEARTDAGAVVIAEGTADLDGNVRATVDARALQVDELHARTVHADVALAGLRDRPRGDVRIDATGVRHAGRAIGPVTAEAHTRDDGAFDVSTRIGRARGAWRLDADAVVSISEGAEDVTIALGRHGGAADGVPWSGRGGTIAVRDDRVTVKQLRASLAGGRVRVDGTYVRAGAGAIEVAIDARDVSLRGREPLDFAVDLEAKPGDVRLVATLHGDAVGSAAVSLDVAAPRRLLDPRAWQRLDRRAVRRGKVTLDRLDLAALAAIAGTDAPVTGRLDGEVTLTRDATFGSLRGRDLVVEGLPGPADADLALGRTAPGIVDATLDLDVRDVGEARVAATIEIPTRPFDVAAWQRLDADAVHRLTARVDDLAIDRDGWQARASVYVDVGRGLSDATITADVLGVRGGPLLRRVDLRVDARADRSGVEADVQVGVGGAWLADVHGALAISPAALWRGGANALRTAPLDGTITVSATPVRRLLRMIGRDQDIDGTVRADATLRGSMAAPVVEAAIALADIAEGEARLRSLDVEVRYAAGEVHLEARGHQDSGGRLRVRADAPLDDLASVDARILADEFELAPLAALGPTQTLGVEGRLDADLSFRGARPSGRLRIRAARVPLDGNFGTLRRGDITVAISGQHYTAEVSGRVGEGTLDAHIAGDLQGVIPYKSTVALDVRGVTMLAPRRPKVDAHVDAKVTRLHGTGQWKVTADVRDAKVVLSSAKGPRLHEVGAPDDLVIVENGVPPPAAAAAEVSHRAFGVRPSTPTLIVEVRLRRTTVRADELRGQVRGKLTLSVGDEAVALDGAIEAIQGDVVLFDRRYRIDRGEIRFDGSDDPRVDVVLVHAFPQLALHVNLRGRLSKPKLDLSSDPASYTQGQLLGFLFGASPGGDPGNETRDAATMVASSLVSAKVGRFVHEYLPVRLDTIRFDAPTASEGASLTVGKWIARKLYVAYRRRLQTLVEQNAGQAEVEYWLSPRIVVEGVAGDRGYHDLDLTWVNRW